MDQTHVRASARLHIMANMLLLYAAVLGVTLPHPALSRTPSPTRQHPNPCWPAPVPAMPHRLWETRRMPVGSDCLLAGCPRAHWPRGERPGVAWHVQGTARFGNRCAGEEGPGQSKQRNDVIRLAYLQEVTSDVCSQLCLLGTERPLSRAIVERPHDRAPNQPNHVSGLQLGQLLGLLVRTPWRNNGPNLVVTATRHQSCRRPCNQVEASARQTGKKKDGDVRSLSHS